MYARPTGKGNRPYERWLAKLSKESGRAEAAVVACVKRFGGGDPSVDYKKIRGHSNLYELRIHMRPGFRVYFAMLDDSGSAVIVLTGGKKAHQIRDIAKAAKYLEDYYAQTAKA